jgi:IS1 family transposase
MNQLPIAKRVQIITLLVEGNSLRSISRICECSINTVTKLLVSVGQACEVFHNTTVKGLQSKRVQADEIWSFVYAKANNLPKEMEGLGGDVWTWTALDADSKLIISWLVGDRTAHSAKQFIADMKDRIETPRIQLSTDGHASYKEAVLGAFDGFIDFAQVVKVFGSNPNEKGHTSECIGMEKTVISGEPSRKHISTSFVERQNLTMRMGMRRFTRSTNAFSKKIENHWLAIALHFVYYNFVRVHKTLRVTPAMEAGITKRPMTIQDIIGLVEKN